MWRYADEIFNWRMAAQAHYSFLENMERGELWRYWRIGGPDGVWDQQYERYSINFVALKAGRVANKPMGNMDEVMLTMGLPKLTHETSLIDTRALVSHYSFDSQHELLHTDLLARYLDYANEMVCARDNQKVMHTSSMVRTSGT